MKKIQKALITLVAALTLATNVAGLASCGGNKGYGDVNYVAYDGSKVTITFYHTMGQGLQTAFNEYYPEFQKLFPNITVEGAGAKKANDYTTLRNQISTELSAGNGPNVSICYPDHVALYNIAGAVAPLDGFIEMTDPVEHADGTTEPMGFTQAQLDDFYDIFYNEGKQYGDGKTYSLPFYKSTEVLYYNKEFFDANNLTPPTTWDEMETLCKRIKEIDTSSTNIPLGYDSEANWFITMTEQMGTPYTSSKKGEYFLFDTAENRAEVERFRRWYDLKYFTTQALNNDNYTSKLLEQTDKSQPHSYMCIGSTGGAAYQVGEMVDGKYLFEVGIAQIPQYDTNDPKVIQQGPSVCVFKKDNDQEVAASWLFVKYFTSSPEFQALSSMKNGYTPVIKSASQLPGYQSQLQLLNSMQGSDRNALIQLATAQQAVAQMDAYFTSPVFEGSSAARDEVGYMMEACISNPLGGKTAAQLIQEKFSQTITKLRADYE